jgi:hypothetical protein
MATLAELRPASKFRAVGLAAWFGPLAAALLVAGCHHDPPPEVVEPEAGIYSEPGWEPPVALNAWKYIVIHHSATLVGSAALFDRVHRQERHFANGLGYHFVIGNGNGSGDGEVEIGRRWKEQLTGAHVGGELNQRAIGVCLVGDFTRTRPTGKQMTSLLKLLDFLQARCRIPSRMVLGHGEARPGHTVCPGDNFSMPDLRSHLAAEPPEYRPAMQDGSGGCTGAAPPIDPETGEPFPEAPAARETSPSGGDSRH